MAPTDDQALHRLRIWREEKLYDCNDYLVAAVSAGEAVERLREAQQRADDSGTQIIVDGIRPAEPGWPNGIAPLQPRGVVDGSSGVCEIDPEGRVVRPLQRTTDAHCRPAVPVHFGTTTYSVRWEILIDADSPEAAVSRALGIQQDAKAAISVIKEPSPHATPVIVEVVITQRC